MNYGLLNAYNSAAKVFWVPDASCGCRENPMLACDDPIDPLISAEGTRGMSTSLTTLVDPSEFQLLHVYLMRSNVPWEMRLSAEPRSTYCLRQTLTLAKAIPRAAAERRARRKASGRRVEPARSCIACDSIGFPPQLTVVRWNISRRRRDVLHHLRKPTTKPRPPGCLEARRRTRSGRRQFFEVDPIDRRNGELHSRAHDQ